jgi:hypothetical protein
MEQDIINYWVFRLCPASDILEAGKHNVSGTDPVSKMLFSSFYNAGRWIKSKNPVILSIIHQNLQDIMNKQSTED